MYDGLSMNLKEASVPGITPWITTSSTSHSGSSLSISSRLIHANVPKTTTSMIAAVREPVDSAPSVSNPPATSQYFLRVRW